MAYAAQLGALTEELIEAVTGLSRKVGEERKKERKKDTKYPGLTA